MRSLLLLFILHYTVCTTFGQNLVEATFIESKTKEQIELQFFGLVDVPYDVDYYKILYTTVDLQGNIDTASGALLIPVARELALPLHIDQHGTVNSRNDVPSEGSYLTAEFVLTLGHIVIAPDLLGLGNSKGFHPYVHADSEASAAIDMYFATTQFLTERGVPFSDQLFLSGYSQGGHSSAALHRNLERDFADQITVTGAVHMAGPHSISEEMRKLFIQEATYTFPAFAAFTYLSYRTVYGIYPNTNQFFKAPYVDLVDQLFDWSIDLDALNTALSAELVMQEGAVIPRFMLQDSIVQILESNQSDHPLIMALRDNDLLDWIPQAPTKYIHCSGDDLIPFANSALADSTMNANGASDVELIDPSALLNHTTCVVTGAALFPALAFFQELQDIQTNVLDPSLPDIELFPNPVASVLQVRHIPQRTRLDLFNAEGRLMLSQITNGNTVALQVGQLPPGLYFLKLQSELGTTSRKIIVRR